MKELAELAGRRKLFKLLQQLMRSIIYINNNNNNNLVVFVAVEMSYVMFCMPSVTLMVFCACYLDVL
jgi:hypothetical protein